ncbi:MAG: abortive infection family protein [Gaiellaceae bacterium]
MGLAPSPRTRQRFREYLVRASVLREIEDYFGGVGGFKAQQLPPEQQPGGERRTLVEQYYAGVDWDSPAAVGKLLRVYEHILSDADAYQADEIEKLVKALRLDGFDVAEHGRINPPATFDLGINSASLDDPTVFREYERRILESVDADPELAIGTAKELIEAVCKLLLADAGEEADTKWTLEQLFKNALKTIDLSVEDVDGAKAGADSIKKVLRGLGQAVVGTAELRNRFGTGHGRHRRPSGLGPRHARLVSGSALVLTRFILDTRAARKPRPDGS